MDKVTVKAIVRGEGGPLTATLSSEIGETFQIMDNKKWENRVKEKQIRNLFLYHTSFVLQFCKITRSPLTVNRIKKDKEKIYAKPR